MATRPPRLLIVDPCLGLRSPSMRGVVLALPALKANGFHIEAWCWDCDPSLPVDKIVRLPRIGKVHTLYYYAFSFWAILRAWWLFRVQKEKRPDVIFSLAWYLPRCDVALVQFSPWDWEKRQRTLGVRSLRDVYERIANGISLLWTNHAVRTTTARTVLCVSKAVAADVRAHNPRLSLSLLPNCYDPERFHPGVREQHRETMRANLRFSADDKVFVFVSTGHYRRKGFLLAVKALALLRKSHPGARLLVVGGLERRLNALRTSLDVLQPDWRDWIKFAGMVPDVEKYFAAADAFLFPSYSEAFALVEVEAAACGLPLFLTRHHGSEMILEDGRNGRFVDFDAEQMSQVLGEFVSGQWQFITPLKAKGLDSHAYGERLAAEFLALVLPAVEERAEVPAHAGSLSPESP
jgi:glycosyltransferase involved in cell wall biosynthesis